MAKVAATVTLLAACVLSPTWAQQPKRPQESQQQRTPRPQEERPPRPPKAAPVKMQNPEATVERLRKLLKLTGDQVFQLRRLVHERNRQLAQVQEQGGTAQDRKAQSDSIQRNFQSELRAILTPNQADRLDAEILARPGAFR